MNFKKHLRTHITLVVVVCFLVFSVILASLSIYYSYGLIRAESEEKLMNLVRTHAKELDADFVARRIIAENIDNYIQTTLDMERVKSDSSYLDTYLIQIDAFIYRLADVYSLAWIYFSPYIDNVARDVWYWDQDNDGTPERMPQTSIEYYDDEENKDWFFVTMREKVPTWTNPYPTTVLEDKSIYWISHAIPIFIDDTFIGVGGSDFYYSDFLETFSQLSVYGSGYGILLNDKNEIIIHPDYNELESLSEIENGEYNWIAEEMKAKETGILEYTWKDGDKKVLAYSHLDNDWILAITASKSVIDQTLYMQIRYMIAVIGIGILLAAFLVYNLAARLTRRLENVTEVIFETGDGNYEAPIPERYLEDESEIGILARAVEIMRIKQKDSFIEIQKYSEDLELLVEERTEELEASNHELEISLEELKVTQEHLVESKKFEAINRFLIEIAHRMNTPLSNSAMTISYMEHILENIEQDIFTVEKKRVQEEINSLKDSIKIASNGIRTSTEIIRGLQVLSKDLKEAMKDTVDLKDILEVCYIEFKNQLINSNEIQLQIECPENLIIETYPVLFLEAFNNLFKYSTSYSMKGQREKLIRIEVEQTKDLILIIYQDKSILKYANVKERIFEPFSISSFEPGVGGMELHLLFNLVNLGLKGKIECLQGEKEEPYFVMELPKKTNKR